MAPLARGSKLAVIMEEAQTEVELGAGGGVPAGAVRPVAFVVVRADLEGKQQTCSEAAQSTMHPPAPKVARDWRQGAARGRSAATAGRAASPTGPEGRVSSRGSHCDVKPNYGHFYIFAWETSQNEN